MSKDYFTIDKSVKQWGENNLKLDALRNVSRKLHKDNAFLSGMDKNFQSLVFSQGINCTFTTENNELIKDAYFDFAQKINVRGDEDINEFARSTLLQVIIDGDCLIYFTTRPDYTDFEITEEKIIYKEKLKIGRVPGHLVKTPPPKTSLTNTKTASVINLDKYVIKDGVVTENGQIIGYCVQTSNSEWLYFPRYFGKYMVSNLLRAPIRAGDPDSARGEPIIAASLKLIDDSSKLLTAEVKSQTLKTKLAAQMEFTDALSEDDIEKATANLEQTLNEISINDTNVLVNTYGTKVTAWDSKQQQQTSYETMIKPLTKVFSQSYCVPFEALTKDLSTASGATARAIYAQAFSDTEVWRQQFWAQVLNPAIYLLMDMKDMNPKDRKTEWQFSVKPFGYLRAKEEYEANRLAVESGQKTLYQTITEQGYLPEEMIAQDKYITELKRKENPLYGVDVEVITSVLEKFNAGALNEAQAGQIFASFNLDWDKYR